MTSAANSNTSGDPIWINSTANGMTGTLYTNQINYTNAASVNYIPTYTTTDTINITDTTSIGGAGGTWIPNAYGGCTWGIANSPEQLEINQLKARLAQLEAELTKIQTPIKVETTESKSNLWFDLPSMLNNIRNCVKSGILKILDIELVLDYPPFENTTKRLAEYQITTSFPSVWKISQISVKETQQQMWINDGAAILIPDCFETENGRKLLLDMLNRK